MKLTKKHDEFVKKCLTDVEMAREFLQNYLPAAVRDKCNFDKLSIVAGSYIEDDLKAHASDIVYKIDLKNNSGCAYVYALIEHQSSPHELMQYRILRYQLAIIQRHLEKHKKDKLLPLVVPIVFYNGTETPYPYSTELCDLFADQELFRQIGLGNFRLADLTVTEDSEIEQHNKLSFLEILAKHIHDKNINKLVRVFQIAQLYKINPSLVQSAIYYILSGREREEVVRLVEELKQNIPEYGGTFMNYAEELRQEGLQQGIQQGMQQGIQQGEHKAQLEIARNLLKSGIDDRVVAKSTNLDPAEISRLKKSMH